MLSIKNLSVKLDNFELKNVSLEIEKGEYFVLAGPSGSGKTILLEALAGVYKIKSPGSITLNHTNITHTKIQQRNLGLVFQDNTLFPHFTVKKNIEFALKQKFCKAETKKKLNDISKNLHLDELLDRNPKTLSGGEIQRALLARTLASNPEILLLDEPLSAVDTHQKDLLKNLLRNLNRNGQTIIHVTHDFEEAYSLASKMGIMHKGKIVDTGIPEEILRNPGNSFVARFCGYKNYFVAVRSSHQNLIITDKVHLKINRVGSIGQEVGVLIDEKKIELKTENKQASNENVFEGTIKDIYKSVKGLEVRVDIGIDMTIITNEEMQKKIGFRSGEVVSIFIPKKAITIINNLKTKLSTGI